MITSLVSRLFADKEPVSRPATTTLTVTLFILAAVAAGTYLLWSSDFAVLEPKGRIAEQQAELIWFATALSMVVIVPVYVLTIVFSLRYRRTNQRARYQPELSHSKRAEIIWWGVPILIILVLSIVTWRTSYALDPYRPLASSEPPLTVQVVALQWKWLFIYPEQGIASVNYLRIPEDRPVNFRITADAPMNTFWIPELGGMVYAMKGMETKLHLEASDPGRYYGRSGNLSGKGFSDMTFWTEAGSQREFDAWVTSVQQKPNRLSMQAYDKLTIPGTMDAPETYGSVRPNLYRQIIDQSALGMHDHHSHNDGTGH